MTIRRTGSRAGSAVRFEAPVLAATPRPLSADELALEELRDEARRMGRGEGLAIARAEVDAAIAAQETIGRRLLAAAQLLEDAAADLRRRDAANLAALESEAVRFSAALAEEIVGAELRAVDAPVLAAVERCIGLVPDRGDLVVRVHPDDAATIEQTLTASRHAATRAVLTIADPAVEPGGCVVEVGACRVDGQLGGALERLRVALRTGSSQEAVDLLAR